MIHQFNEAHLSSIFKRHKPRIDETDFDGQNIIFRILYKPRSTIKSPVDPETILCRYHQVAWLIIYTYVNQWDVITRPCHNSNGGIDKPPLKLGHGWVITSYKKYSCDLYPYLHLS